MSTARRVDPSMFIILGGTGDLARRKLLPALARLDAEQRLGPHVILGVARDAELDDLGYRAWAREALAEADLGSGELAEWCDSRLHYQPIGGSSDEEFRHLAERVMALEIEHDLPGNRVLYLALPPRAFPRTIEGLAGAGLATGPGYTRLVLEKPFGRDLESAVELNELVHRHFDERQVYRIDHYLGKETVQNLLVFRFSNAIFESLWSRDRVANVQITVAESLGVEGRAGYYDQTGATRDMVQNHLAQLVSLVGMEVPSTFDADSVRYEKIKLLKAIAPISPADVVLGQYGSGEKDGDPLDGYLEEPGVEAHSQTETFVAMKLRVDTWRWQGVPFYVRTGKRLPRRLTQIAVTFHHPPVFLFDGGEHTAPNVLFLELQPNEGFALCFDVKTPGEPFALETLPLDFHYRDRFGAIPEAYQTLLLDLLEGDQTLFVHAEEAEASWRLFGSVIDAGLPVLPYAGGSWGPEAAGRLLERSGHRWKELDRISSPGALKD